MLEVNESVEIHPENLNEIDFRIQYLNSIEDFQLKSTLPEVKKGEELQFNDQSLNNENCIITACLAGLKNSDNHSSTRPYKPGLILKVKYQENSPYKTSLDKASEVEIKSSNAYYPTNWRNQWEKKCREWLYRDNFNIEVLNFAKKLYFP